MPKNAKSVSSPKPKKGNSVSGNKWLSVNAPPALVFHCLDWTVNVDYRCCYESELIAALYFLGIVHFAVRAREQVVLQVIKFCIKRYKVFEKFHHDNQLLSVYLEKFDGCHSRRFREGSSEITLRQLKEVAGTLKIASLFNMIHYLLHGELPKETPNWKKKGEPDLTRAGWDEALKSTFYFLERKLNSLQRNLNNGRAAAIRYRGIDRKIVNVAPKCCYESEDVKAALIQTEVTENDNYMKHYWGAEVGDIGRFPINVNVPSKFLSIAHYYCMAHVHLMEEFGDDENLFLDMVKFFDCCFVRSKPLYSLLQLMQAAYGMRIKSLFYLTRNAIVDRFDKKPSNIIKIYNLPDFNHEVWQESWLSYAKGWPHGKNVLIP